MLSVLPALVVLTVASTGPQVDVRDPTGCVEPQALGPALQDALPGPWQAVADTLALSVDVSVGPDGEASLLGFRLVIAGSPTASLIREVPVIPADCSSLVQLIAVVVGRHLAELPRDAWPEVLRPRPAPAPPRHPLPGGVTEAAPPARESVPATGSLTLRLGLEAGVDASLWGGSAGVDATVFGAQGYALRVGLEAIAYAPVAIGAGAAQLTTIVARLGPAWELTWGPVILSFAVGLGGGVTIGRGSGFERDASTVGAAVRGWADATVRTRWGLAVSLGGALALVRPRLSVSGAPAQIEMPTGRLGVSVGYAFGG